MNHGLDTDEIIYFYEQEFYPLSNFSSFSMMWRGNRFDTSEHVYQFEKFRGAEIGKQALVRSWIRNSNSAHDAFKIAEEHKKFRRNDWDDIKVEIMREILLEKTGQHEYVRRKLLQTGERELVENSWRDNFWGCGPNRDGQNMLGKLWMEIRQELR
jgi:ribA/ribD-fused uncharacterized protein